MKRITIKVPFKFKRMLDGWSTYRYYYLEVDGKIELVIEDGGVEYVIVEDKDLTKQES